MKVLVKIGVLLLMLALLFAAFVLPKFVQRTEPPMPEEDLAAALAAVELGDEAIEEDVEPVASEETSELRNDSRLTEFYAALDKEDFVASSDELVRLSSELDPDTVDLLTVEMESAVASMAAEVEPAESKIPLLEGAPLVAETTEAEEIDTLAEPADLKPSKPAADPSAVVAFFALVQSGDFETAQTELKRLNKTVDPETASSMQAALNSAETRAEELAASREELAKSQQEMARLQKESVVQLQESVKQLAEVTKAAQQATKEASRLKTELATVESDATASDTETNSEPIELPKTRSVAFGFDSTFLNDASKKTLTDSVISALNDEKRLDIQLRGHADTAGPSDYNGILAQARCEVVKDFLLEQGIGAARISIVSFGETQAAATGGTAEELRRVDILFRES